MAAVTLILLNYARGFPGGQVSVTGSDAYAYAADAQRAVNHAVSELGNRPSVATFSAALTRLHGILPATSETSVASALLLVAVALAAASFVRLAWRLPSWTIGVVAFAIGTWAGTVRLACGYTANLLALTCSLVAFVAWTVGHREKTIGIAGTTLAVAAGVAHPLLLPVRVARSLVAGLIDHLSRSGWSLKHLRRWHSFRLFFWYMLATLLVAVLVAFALDSSGKHLTAILSSAPLRELITQHHSTTLNTDLAPGITAVLASVGVLFCAALPRGVAATRVFAIGVGWFAVNLTFGVILYTLEAPFYRFFFSIIPIPFLIGMGICGLLLYAEGHLSHAVAEVPVATNEQPPSNQFVRWGSAHLNARKLGIGLAALAAGVVGIILVADSGRAVVERFSAVSNAPVEMTANDVATYIAAAKPQGEVVLVYPGTRLQDMLGAPVFADAARAASPNAAIGVYIGPGPDALASRPPRAATNNGTYEGVRSAISADAWQTTGPGMQDATLLVDRSMLAAQPELFDHLARQYPGGLITPGLLVLRGPVVAISASTQGFPTISKWRLLLIVLVLIGLMASIGGGVAFLAAHGAPIGTVLALSPACGVGVSLVATFTAALARTDPAGPIAGVLVLLLSVIAYVLAWRTHGAERASEKA